MGDLIGYLRLLHGRLVKFRKYCYYSIKVRRIEQRVKSNFPKRIVFFTINLGMWKYDDLFEKLLKDDAFDPIIVSFLYPYDSVEYRMSVQESMKSYFESKGFPFIECYNFAEKKWFDVNSLNPDIIFYAQPYNTGFKHLRLEKFWNNVLFAYLPYAFNIENEKSFYNTLYLNICRNLYYPTSFHKKYEGKALYNKGKYGVVCGNPVIEKICFTNVDFRNVWKNTDSNLKRVIWAPHHTINSSDILQYSNFLDIADDMLLLAKKCQNQVQFAFKPHPRLKTKLYTCAGWGKEKTDLYYEEWASLPNTCFIEGDYVDLFVSSDAMIHDCSSFAAEYIASGHPVMFVAKVDVQEQLNELGLQCLDLHYRGKNICDIERFLNYVVINQIDEKKEARNRFVKEFILNRTGKCFSDIIVADLKKKYCI